MKNHKILWLHHCEVASIHNVDHINMWLILKSVLIMCTKCVNDNIKCAGIGKSNVADVLGNW